MKKILRSNIIRITELIEELEAAFNGYEDSIGVFWLDILDEYNYETYVNEIAERLEIDLEDIVFYNFETEERDEKDFEAFYLFGWTFYIRKDLLEAREYRYVVDFDDSLEGEATNGNNWYAEIYDGDNDGDNPPIVTQWFCTESEAKEWAENRIDDLKSEA